MSAALRAARRLCAALALALLAAPGALAHELRPAYLELREEAPGEFEVLWKTPARGELQLAILPVFSGRVEVLTPVVTRDAGRAAIQTWRIRAVDPLGGQTIHVEGLEATMTDALVRVTFADGATWVERLTPQRPAAEVPTPRERQGGWSVAGVYLGLGVEHILFGFDHLLFVLALMLITRGLGRLMKTITAFTLAHSVTLGLATLGIVRIPSAPVEAVIALSIVFVAAEIVRARRGQEGAAARAPWVVAFTFGLLHGFGFAGALAEVGLPEGHIPTALLFFNVGVEAGQLIFVGAVLAAVALVRRSKLSVPRWAELAPPYAIGTLAMFWVIQRVAAF